MKELQPVSILSPGYFGLNTQDSSVALPTNFSLTADNCIIDKFGRIGSRKGWTQVTTSGSTALAGKKIQFAMEHVEADNTTTVISGGNNKVFKNGVGNSLTNITPAGYTVTGDNWSGATLNDIAFIVQDDHEPLVYEAGTIEAYSDYTAATPSFGSNTLSHVIAAYGRFWGTDGKSVYWSTDIADSSFPNFSGGTAGFLNIASVLPNNTDTITCLAAHNNFLIIFCNDNIVIYKGADNPISEAFSLEDVLIGVGCVARDSVQNTGNVILFLSDSGVRILGRLIQEKSLPMRELTKNIRDDVIQFIDLEVDNTNIKSVYSETNSFYLLSFPAQDAVLCIDTRQALEDGSARCTLWRNYPSGGMVSLRDNRVLIGKSNGFGLYGGYTDNGSKYRMSYRSAYIDLQAHTTNKMLKRASIVVIGGGGQEFNILIGYDYRGDLWSYPYTIDDNGIYEWGVDEWGIAEWSTGMAVEKVHTPTDGSGTAFQVGFETDIDGREVSVQRLDVFVKTGRIR